MKGWIYESPDGGETIYRRRFNEYGDKELITNKVWAENRDNYGYKDIKSNHLMTNFLGTPYIDVRVDFNSWIPKAINEFS